MVGGVGSFTVKINVERLFFGNTLMPQKAQIFCCFLSYESNFFIKIFVGEI